MNLQKKHSASVPRGMACKMLAYGMVVGWQCFRLPSTVGGGGQVLLQNLTSELQEGNEKTCDFTFWWTIVNKQS